MRAVSVAAVLVACAPAAADPGAFRIGLLCDGTMPLAFVVEGHRPGAIALRIDDAFGACVAALKESAQWQGGT
jgi:hypothetical protein